MMLCPLKFARYEFEGGEECIGAECGFYGSVCDMDMSLSVQKCPNELPEGDAVAIMRKASGELHAVDYARLTLKATDTSDMFAKLADMVERDYVSRENIEGVMDTDRELVAENIRLRAECDELKAFSERLEMAAHDKLGVTLFGVDYVTEEFMLHVRDTLTAEQVEDIVYRNTKFYEGGDVDVQAIADELNAELGSGKAKDLLLRTFGLAQMMHDCWLEECKAGDNVDVSACNAYSYEFDQIAQAMFDMGTDPNDSDYYRSAELGRGTCECIKGKCSNCGKDLPEDPYSDYEGNFCPSCGARIRKAVKR